MKKVFISYHFDDDEEFAGRLNASLSSQPDIETFYYAEKKTGEAWSKLVERYLATSDVFILIAGKELGNTEIGEAQTAQNRKIPNLFVVVLPADGVKASDRILTEVVPLLLQPFRELDPIRVNNIDEYEKCAREIVGLLGLTWDCLGIPEEYPFEYEKDIIAEYMNGRGKVSEQWALKGCPLEWPVVDHKLRKKKRQNPVPASDIGTYRDWDEKTNLEKNPRILVAALSDYHESQLGCPLKVGLTFAEAGPRKFHYYPRRGDNLTIGILVSGGIAPGLNAVISGIIDRHRTYYDALRSPVKTLKIHCYREGFNSLIQQNLAGPNYELISLSNMPDQQNDSKKIKYLTEKAFQGGSFIPTARTPSLMESQDSNQRRQAFNQIVTSLVANGVEILYVVGGDGSMKAAHAIQNCAQERGVDLSVVAIPKTMDNDILWVWQSFGFPSAVEWAKEAVQHLHTEVESNPRLGVIQLFGSDSGFVVCHAALASGACDLVLIPEVEFEIKDLVKYIKTILTSRHAPGIDGRSPHGTILMAETAIPKTLDGPRGFDLDDVDFKLTEVEKLAVKQFFTDNRRVKGQTPDELRNAGLKIVVGAANKAIRDLCHEDDYWRDFRVFTNEPRHLLRAATPSSTDILFARRLGTLAVDGSMAGYHDFMISQWLTEYVMVPLELVILGRKRVPRHGIFWKSVLASTGQPAKMAELDQE